jgi:hypothetical protein
LKKEYWLKKSSIKRRIRESLVDEVYQIVEDSQPVWASPWVSYSCKCKSLYISLTEEGYYSAYLKWSEFVEIIADSDKETLEAFLPKLEKLCNKVRKILVKG